MKKFLGFIFMLSLLFLFIACDNGKITITFDTNGGSTIAAIEVKEGETFTLPPAPTKEGFTFDGWFEDKEFTTAWSAKKSITKDITLYAKWLNDQDIVDLAYEMLTLTGIDNLTNSSPRLILPIKAANYEKVEITWSIDKTQYISTAGVITQPEHEVGDQTVTLTATLKLNQAQKIKTFTATVKALPPLSETVPLLDEDFKNYPDGEVGSSLGDWALVSGKAGTSVYTVVSSIENVTIPGGSKALKLQAFSERQFEMAIPHNYDVVVIEADLMQTASSEATSINIQSSASSPIVGFGLNGDEIYWRVNNGSQHGVPIELNKFYRVRFEIDLVNKTVQLFYYEDGQLMPITSEPQSYTGDLALTSIFLRTGSSNTTSIRPPAYVSNILINRIEALPRPAESVKLGEIQDLPATQNIAVGSTFIPSVPKVLNYYGSKRDLVKDTDYTLAISGEVNTAVAGNYNVVYTFTNKNNSEDVKTITQVVTVYSEEQPNEISSVETSFVPYPNRKTDITVTVVQPEGVLYYLFSNNETETAEAIKAGISVNITSGTVEIDDAEVGENAYIHIIVVLNGDSNIKSEALDRQLLVEIDTPQKFYDAVHASESEQKKSYYLLIADLDFTDFTWGDQEKSFKTVFDGNGHTISNLTITKEKIGGIFALAEDAIIKNLIIDNVQMSSSKQGALLVGETRGEVRIENIVILNSSYAYETAGSDKVGYAALIVGRIRGGSTTIVNVAISDSDVSNIHKYSAAIVAGTESGITLVMEDIYIQNVDVIEDSGSSECVGVLIGRLKGTADINRVVAVDVFLQAYKNLGGLIGKYETATAPLSISNVFIQGEVECTYSESLTVNAVIGSNAGEPTLSNVWVSGFANSRTSGLSVPEEFKVVFDTVKADAWWTEKMPEIANSDLWAANQQHIQALSNFLATEKPYFAITLVYNLEIEDEVIQVQQGKSLVHTPASMPGYNFVGWFTDEELIEALPENYRISAAVTLYGKYEPAPASTVSFVTNVEGVTIPSQQINYGNKATAPASQQAMVGEVKIEITGWTLNGERFDFNTPITESIELVAVWTTVKYTVKFDGGNSVQVEYGQTVTAPATPTKFFEEYVFTAWLLDGTPFDFETPITADINLVSLFTVSGPIQIDTVEEFIHLVTNEYSDDFILMNDLDFATYEWKQSDKGKAFKGSFDGQNHTLSNITITSEGSSNDVYGGIFQRVDGATIKNLKINNANINNSQGRAGILAGRIENNSTTLENIIITNSELFGNRGEGVGILVGHAAIGFTANKITIKNSSAENAGKDVGILVGRLDGVATINDIYLFASSSKSQATSTDAGVGGVVGYTNHNDAHLIMSRVVLEDCVLEGRSAGSLVGYYRYGALTVTDCFVDVEFVYSGSNGQHGIIGSKASTTDEVLTNVYGHHVNRQGLTTAIQLPEEYELTALTALSETWWSEKINAIAVSELWTYVIDTKFFNLK